jgi:hypothetical protein
MRRLIFKSGLPEKLLAVGMFTLIVLFLIQACNDWLLVAAITIMQGLIILGPTLVRRSIFNDDAFKHRTVLGYCVNGNYNEISEVQCCSGKWVMIRLANNNKFNVWAFQGDIISLIEWLNNKTDYQIPIKYL